MKEESPNHLEAFPKNLQPTARKGKKLSFATQKEAIDERKKGKGCTDAHLQRCEASWKNRQKDVDLPQGWSKEKIVLACRKHRENNGTVKGFVQQWNARYQEDLS